jgi:hypothetical protein
MGTFSGIDPALIKGMNDALASGAETLRRGAGSLRQECGWFGVGTAELQEITSIAAWAEDQLPGLRRRQQLAAAMDARDGRVNGGLVQIPDDFLDAATATARGRALAEQIQLELERDGRLSPDTLRGLQDNAWDPAFAAGFYDSLGPTGLCRLSLQLLNSDRYRDHPDELKTVLQALGTGLATYSRDHRLDNAWLDRFAVDPEDDGRGRLHRPDLLAPLLAGANGATFDKDFLQAVGNRMLHTENLAELEWMSGGDGNANPYERDHYTQVWRVIAQHPLAAGEFYRDNFDLVQQLSRTPGGHPYDSVYGTGGHRGQAIADLVLAGTVGVREHNQPLAELNTAHLLFDVHKHKGEHVYPQMEAVYGKIVHAWFADLAYSVTTPVPTGMALIDPATGDIVDDWDGVRFWVRSDVGRRGIEVPQELWDAMLQEAMRDPEQAAALGLDFAAYVHQNVHDVSRLNPSDERATRYLNLENGRMQGFYLHAFQQTTAGLEGDVRKWVDDMNAARKTLIDKGFALAPGLVTSPQTTLVDLGRSLGTDILKGVLEDWVRVDASDAPQEMRDRLARVGASEYDTSWQTNWQQYGEEAYEAWRSNDKPIQPVTIVDRGTARTYTGDPHDYITRPAQDFLTDDGHILPVEEMSAEQAAAYARWLQDPAVVARILQNGAAEQELAKLMA